MFGDLIAMLLKAIIFGVIGIIGGGFLFESGKGYVRAGGSTEFSGKLEALPFFFGTVAFGWFIQNADDLLGAPIESFVYSIPSNTRLGGILILTMVAFNYSVPDFNYLDRKSAAVCGVGLLIALQPYV